MAEHVPQWAVHGCTFIGAFCVAFWTLVLGGCGVANLHKRTFGRRQAYRAVVSEAEAIVKEHAR